VEYHSGDKLRETLVRNKLAFNLGVALLLVTALAASSAKAQVYRQGFEAVGPPFFQTPMNGSASDGSFPEISAKVAHTGGHSAHIVYRFSGRGSLSLVLMQPPTVVTSGDKARISMWVDGRGKSDLSGGSLLLLDGGGETFLYNFDKKMADALDGKGWSEVSADFDLSKSNGHWGGKNTGVIQLPVKFLGLGFGHWPDQAAQGDLYIDDIAIMGDPNRRASAAR
jgi:hypothetical protein